MEELVYECEIGKEGARCDGIGIEHSGDILTLKGPSGRYHVLFIHGPRHKVLCNGAEFQVLGWGSERYTLWRFNGGTSQCVVVEGLVVEECGEYYYLGRSLSHECSWSPDKYAERAIELLGELGVAAFVTDVDEISGALPNMLSMSNAEKNREILSRIR